MSLNKKLFLILAILLPCTFGFVAFLLGYSESKLNAKRNLHIFEKQKRVEATTGERKAQKNAEKGTLVISSLKSNMFLLILFTSWVDRQDKYIVQNRTVRNWLSFGPHIHPVIFTNDTNLGYRCQQHGWSVLPLKHTAAGGVPVVKYMFLDVMHHFNAIFYGFANADILFNDGLVKSLVTIRQFTDVYTDPVLVTGRRTNVDYTITSSALGWRNITSLRNKGKLATALSADYFITTKDYPWKDMEEIIIGHLRVDNWIIQFSQLKNVVVINSTPTILALHQTTEAGNFENSLKPNRLYNQDLVKKGRNITINIREAQVGCGLFVTQFVTTGQVRIVKQTRLKECKVS